MKRSTRVAIIFAVVGLAVIVTLLLSPIPQPVEYHDFADQREIFGIPHFFNVVSNLALVLVGAWGLMQLMETPTPGKRPPRFLDERERWPWFVVFQATFLTGFGSAYYHWMPTNQTLFWDRLPMTLITMGLLSAVIFERINLRAGVRSLLPLLLIGVFSVIFGAANDDLRLYGLVQFLPLLLIPLLILLFAPRYSGTGGYFGALGWYVLSRIAEVWDQQIYALGQIISGHTLKHLLAALAVYWLYRMISGREPVPGGAVRNR